MAAKVIYALLLLVNTMAYNVAYNTNVCKELPWESDRLIVAQFGKDQYLHAKEDLNFTVQAIGGQEVSEKLEISIAGEAVSLHHQIYLSLNINSTRPNIHIPALNVTWRFGLDHLDYFVITRQKQLVFGRCPNKTEFWPIDIPESLMDSRHQGPPSGLSSLSSFEICALTALILSFVMTCLACILVAVLYCKYRQLIRKRDQAAQMCISLPIREPNIRRNPPNRGPAVDEDGYWVLNCKQNLGNNNAGYMSP